MAKQKCETCLIWHGGFHLCNGEPVDPTIKHQKSQNIWSYGLGKAAGPKARWEAEYARNRERDLKVLQMYMDGNSLSETAAAFGLHKIPTRSIILRLGGTIRSRTEANLIVQAQKRKKFENLQF